MKYVIARNSRQTIEIRTALAFRTLFAFAFCATLAAMSARAQLTSGSVSGSITDPQGARVVGAKVTLQDEAQAEIRSMKSTSDGTFAFTPVIPSTYTLTIETTGFRKFVQSRIVVDVNQHLELPVIRLEVGAVNDTITVEANALQLQTESAEKATVLTGEQTVDLPLVDRGFMGLLAIVPAPWARTAITPTSTARATTN